MYKREYVEIQKMVSSGVCNSLVSGEVGPGVYTV